METSGLIEERISMGRYAILEYDVLIDSSEVELKDWIRIASDIELNYALYDAFIVLHGTDSEPAYTLPRSGGAAGNVADRRDRAQPCRTAPRRSASSSRTSGEPQRHLTLASRAHSRSLLPPPRSKTVILTGSQIPLSELFNDSIDNLLGALILAGHYVIPEVCLFFNHKLLRGNRSIKASSEEFDAFASPNLAPLASVGIEIDVAWGEVLRPGLRPFRAHKALSSKVATLRVFPGITGAAVRAFLGAGDVRGVVLESFGAGNAPRREELLGAFREAADRGVVIVNVSQCKTGAVAPDIYETGRALAA